MKVLNAIRRFVKEEDGVTALEYGLIAATTCIAMLAALTVIGPALKDTWDQIAAKM
jgi:pilus assembly protein Flp/PilA